MAEFSPHGLRHVADRRHHDDHGIAAAQPAQHLEPGHVWKPHIQQDEIGMGTLEEGDPFFSAVRGGDYMPAGPLEERPESLGDRRLVIDNEN